MLILLLKGTACKKHITAYHCCIYLALHTRWKWNNVHNSQHCCLPCTEVTFCDLNANRITSTCNIVLCPLLFSFHQSMQTCPFLIMSVQAQYFAVQLSINYNPTSNISGFKANVNERISLFIIIIIFLIIKHFTSIYPVGIFLPQGLVVAMGTPKCASCPLSQILEKHLLSEKANGLYMERACHVILTDVKLGLYSVQVLD